MSLVTPATQTLDLLGISYRLFEHPQPPESLEQAAHARGQAPEQIVRSIVFRLAEGQFAMVLMAGPGFVEEYQHPSGRFAPFDGKRVRGPGGQRKSGWGGFTAGIAASDPHIGRRECIPGGGNFYRLWEARSGNHP